MNRLNRLDKFNGILTYLLFLLSFWYVTWTLSGTSVDGTLLDGVRNQWYFTNQTNTLVVIVSVLFWSRFEDKVWFKYFAQIVLVNIVITATGFHFILAPETIDFYGHLSHTIVPIVYVIFYFTAVRAHLKLSKFWVLIIYPMLYLGLALLFGTWPLGQYPYGFIDVDANGLENVLRFTLLFMLPGYTFLALLLSLVKIQLEKRVFNKDTDSR
jgi:hypothetical protein